MPNEFGWGLLCVCNNTLLRTTIVYVVNYKIFWLHNNCSQCYRLQRPITLSHQSVSYGIHPPADFVHISLCTVSLRLQTAPVSALRAHVSSANRIQGACTNASLSVLTAVEYTFTVGRCDGRCCSWDEWVTWQWTGDWYVCEWVCDVRRSRYDDALYVAACLAVFSCRENKTIRHKFSAWWHLERHTKTFSKKLSVCTLAKWHYLQIRTNTTK